MCSAIHILHSGGTCLFLHLKPLALCPPARGTIPILAGSPLSRKLFLSATLFTFFWQLTWKSILIAEAGCKAGLDEAAAVQHLSGAAPTHICACYLLLLYIHTSLPTYHLCVSASLLTFLYFVIHSFVLIYSSSQRIPKFGKFLGPTVLPFSLCSFAAIFSYSAIPFRTTTQKGKGTECHTIALR